MNPCNTITNFIDMVNKNITEVNHMNTTNKHNIFWAHFKVANLDELEKLYNKENILNKMLKKLNKEKNIYESSYFALHCPINGDEKYTKMQCKKIYNLFTHLQDKEEHLRATGESSKDYMRLMLNIEEIYKTKCK